MTARRPVRWVWWRTHPVGHRLLGVLACELLLVAVPGRGLGAVLWLAVDLWLVHRIRRSSGIAWVALLALSVLAAALGVLAVVQVGVSWPAVAVVVLNTAVVALLLTPVVRGWVGRSGLLSLPGEH